MKAYRTEVKLNKEQEILYKLTTSACRFVWNLFISTNKTRYENKEKYMNNYDFSKWFNNTYLLENEDKKWLKQAGSKSLRKTMMNCDETYKRAIKNKKGFPKFKKASTDKTGVYFVRVSLTQPIKCERHKIKAPMFKDIYLKEKAYLPLKGIISGAITKRANKYFISVIVEEETIKDNRNDREGLGIDWGVKTFVTCSNGVSYENINKTNQIKKLNKSLKRQQRALSRKYEFKKREKRELYSKNYDKNKLKVAGLYYRLENIRASYINKCVDDIIKKRPKFITLENLNVSGMVRNKHLCKAILGTKPYYTKQTIIQKATKHNIEVREVSRFYPSSKTCSKCGAVNKDLKLKDRTFKCSCGLDIDRDLNASVNLKNCKEYKTLNNINNTDGLSEIYACGVLQQTVLVTCPTDKNEAGHVEARKSLSYLKDLTNNILYGKILLYTNKGTKYD